MKPSGSCVPLLSCARRSWRYPSSADHSALCLARQAIPSSRLPKGFCCRSKPADTLSRAPITRPFPLQERSSLDSPLEGDGFELVVPRGDRASVSRLRRFVDQFVSRAGTDGSQTLCWRGMDSKFQFRDASPPPTAWAPSFRAGEWRLLEPPKQLYRFAEADDRSGGSAAPTVDRPQPDRSLKTAAYLARN